MKMKKIFASLSLVLAAPAFAQDAVAFKLDDVTLRPIKFNEFVAQVKESNVWVRSKKLSNESTASWQQSMSAYNMNPSFSYSRGTFYAAAPMESYRTPQSGTFTLSGNIEGRGKQSARKEFSGAEVVRQSVDLGAMVYGVEVDSAFLFLDALRVKNLWMVKDKALTELEKMGGADNKQAIDDYKQFKTDQANDFKYFALGMASYLGKPGAVLPEPTADLNVPIRDFDVRSLVDNARRSRPDILSLEAAFNVAKASDNLATLCQRTATSISASASTPQIRRPTAFIRLTMTRQPITSEASRTAFPSACRSLSVSCMTPTWWPLKTLACKRKSCSMTPKTGSISRSTRR